MKVKKIIAEVIDPGKCRYYKKGQKFVLNGAKPEGLCDSAYVTLMRYAKQLLFDDSYLPDTEPQSVMVRCEQVYDSIWELRTQKPDAADLAEENDISVTGSASV